MIQTNHPKNNIRIFIGINASNKLTKKVVDWKVQNKDLPVRFIEESNLHLTLVSPWYINPGDLKKVTGSLEKIQSLFHPFNIIFTNISLGPNPKRPNLIWLTGNQSEELTIMKKTITDILHQPVEKREFIPHLTLARFKFANLRNSFSRVQVSWSSEVDNITLYESRLLKSEAQYRILYELKL